MLTREHYKKIRDYRNSKSYVERFVREQFPVGCTVAPLGCKRENWKATTGEIVGSQVWCMFNNGQSFFVEFDDIELA